MLTVVDYRAGLPIWWTLGEGPPVILTGVAMLYLLRKARQTW